MSRQKRQVSSSRRCAKCNAVYYRCNKFAVWDKQNPGHRAGWHKEEAKYCTNCQPTQQVERILVVAANATLAPQPLKLVSKERKLA